MHFLEQVPLPTPTEALDKAVEAVNDNIAATQKLVESVGNLTALGVIALIVVLGILYVVLVARKRSTDNDTLKLQAIQTDKLITQMQKDREERGDLLKRLFDRDEQRENRTIDSIGALTAVMESIRAVVSELKVISTAYNSREIQTAAMLESMATKGSPPVQELKTAMETAIKALTRIEARLEPFDELVTTLSDIKRKLNIAEFASDKLIEEATAIKRKTDSQPIPTIAVDTTPTPQLGATT